MKFKIPLRVLVVEDNAINQLLIKHILENMGCSVKGLNNGEEAINFLAETDEDFNIILMDIQMPIMDGYTASRKIKEGRFKNIPVIGVSANILKEDLERGKHAGMDGHITKPFNQIEIFETISRFVKDQ